jgi:hypothetical protein
MRLLWRHFANRVVVITNGTQLRFLNIRNHERHLGCLDYHLTDIRLIMTFRPVYSHSIPAPHWQLASSDQAMCG